MIVNIRLPQHLIAMKECIEVQVARKTYVSVLFLVMTIIIVVVIIT